MPGGVSCFMRKVLKAMFLSDGANLTTGFHVATAGAMMLLRASFAGFVADEKAHNELMSVKGASGSKPCPTCKNICRRLNVASSSYLLDISSCNGQLFDRHTNETFYEMIDMLRSKKSQLSKRNFEQLQQCLGMNCDEDSLFFDDELRSILRPVDNCIRDWMHTLASGGVAGTEISLFIHELLRNGVQLQHLVDYSSRYKLPKSQGKVSSMWFAAHRINDEQTRTPAASDHITIVVLLKAFADDALAPLLVMTRHCRCMSLLCVVLDVLTLGPDDATPHVERLKSAIVEQNTLFVEL